MTDLIRREDAARIAEDYNLDIWEYSTGNRSRIGSDPVAEAIRALPAVTVQAQIDAAVKAEREWWITSLAPIRHQAASTRGEQAYRELPSFVVNVLTALIRKGDQP